MQPRKSGLQKLDGQKARIVHSRCGRPVNVPVGPCGRTRVVEKTDVRTLQGFVAKHTAEGAQVYTDDAKLNLAHFIE